MRLECIVNRKEEVITEQNLHDAESGEKMHVTFGDLPV